MGKRGVKPKPPLERLAALSEWQGDCLVWTGWADPKGYGVTKYGPRSMRVHRISWFEHFGPPPPSKPCVLHHCDNPPCWNPEHLFVGTRADNNLDMRNKGRASGGRAKFAECRRGHPYDEENTRVRPDGARVCRQCHREAQRRYVGN